MRRTAQLVVAAFVVFSVMPAAAFAQSAAPERKPDVIFVPTPDSVIKAMLELAKVDENSVVYDLGCGDGRIVIAAARDFGARAVGVDIDPQRIKEANENAAKAGVTDRVTFIVGDMFTADIKEATAVTLYLLSALNQKLRPKLQAELRPGTPIVSHAFAMGDWKPEQTLNVGGRTVYLWHVGR